MGLFYAYLKNSPDDIIYRYLITFVNRDAADEWWRMISTAPSPFTANIQRISPQFYTQNANLVNVVTTSFLRPDFAPPKQFLDKMFFTLLNDRDGRIISVAPPLNITDHISGNWYFIRSQTDTQRYWYFRGDGECLVCGNTACDSVHVSTQFRSRFCVRVSGDSVPKNFVVIGSDEVFILASKDYTLRINDAGELVGTRNPGATTDIKFRDLKNRFCTQSEKLENGKVICDVVAVDRGLGQAWELVD